MAITKYPRACSRNSAGNSKVFLTEISNITSVTYTAGEVSAITMNASTKFHEVGADIDSIQFTQEGAGGSSYGETQKIVMKASKKTAALIAFKNSIVDAAPCGLAVIRQDSNGNCFLSGWNSVDKNGRPYSKVEVAFDSGVAPTDEGMNSYTLTLSCMNGQDESPIDATLTGTIVGETATFIDFN